MKYMIQNVFDFFTLIYVYISYIDNIKVHIYLYVCYTQVLKYVSYKIVFGRFHSFQHLAVLSRWRHVLFAPSLVKSTPQK